MLHNITLYDIEYNTKNNTKMKNMTQMPSLHLRTFWTSLQKDSNPKTIILHRNLTNKLCNSICHHYTLVIYFFANKSLSRKIENFNTNRLKDSQNPPIWITLKFVYLITFCWKWSRKSYIRNINQSIKISPKLPIN